MAGVKTKYFKFELFGRRTAGLGLVMMAMVALLGARPARASERWETLEAIHRLENPYDSPKPGRYGELGAYQFREMTWRMHTQVPFSMALDRRVSDEVAISHYEWLKRRLERNGLAVTPYNIAMAWNAGAQAVVRGRVPASTRWYAERAQNIVGELKRRQLVARN